MSPAQPDADATTSSRGVALDPVLHLSLPVRDLAEARAFYVDGLGCRLGRVRQDWIDVWFYGMQLTLQERPDEVLAPSAQGVRHFGVTLEREELAATLRHLEAASIELLAPLATATDAALNGKTGVMLADPSGNVIELKTYQDRGDLLGPVQVTEGLHRAMARGRAWEASPGHGMTTHPEAEGGDPACWAHLFEPEPDGELTGDAPLARLVHNLADAVVICDAAGTTAQEAG